jgi:hypothetical protein
MGKVQMSHIIYTLFGIKNGHAFFNFKMKEFFYILKLKKKKSKAKYNAKM